MKIMACIWCGADVKVAEDTIEVVCSHCFMRQAMKAEKYKEERLKEYNPKDCKKKRKKMGITQKDLSMITGVPLYKISQFEGGHIFPPKRLREWIDQ